MIYLAFFNFISLLISKAITTTHIFIRKTFNGINKKDTYSLNDEEKWVKKMRELNYQGDLYLAFE